MRAHCYCGELFNSGYTLATHIARGCGAYERTAAAARLRREIQRRKAAAAQ